MFLMSPKQAKVFTVVLTILLSPLLITITTLQQAGEFGDWLEDMLFRSIDKLVGGRG